MNDIVKYDTDNGVVELTPSVVKQYLVSGKGNVSDGELVVFMQLCKFQKLNPFLKEAYLIKYSSDNPATMVVGKDVFTKRAAADPDCDGWENGVLVKTSTGSVEYRKGLFITEGEALVGGWARVYRKSWKVPLERAVSMAEYNRGINNWKSMPATMIAKVALVQALREAFPNVLQGLYDEAEIVSTTPAEMNAQTKPERVSGAKKSRAEEIKDQICTPDAEVLPPTAALSKVLNDIQAAKTAEELKNIDTSDLTEDEKEVARQAYAARKKEVNKK